MPNFKDLESKISELIISLVKRLVKRLFRDVSRDYLETFQKRVKKWVPPDLTISRVFSQKYFIALK